MTGDCIKREDFRVLDRYLSTLPYGSRILDGGCGNGEVAKHYGQCGHRVFGIDLDWSVLPADVTWFFVRDVRRTGFQPAYFDAYYSLGVWEHIEDGLSDCFAEARRILKPGGLLVVSVPYMNTRHQRRGSGVEFRNGEFYQYRYSLQELDNEFERNGFQVLEIRPIGKWQGLKRMVIHDLRITNATVRRLFQIALYPFVSRYYVAHMLICIGKRDHGA